MKTHSKWSPVEWISWTPKIWKKSIWIWSDKKFNDTKDNLFFRKGKTRKHSEILGDVFEGILEEDSNTKRKTEYFDKKNLAKPLNRSKTYNEICEIYKYYKNGTLPSKNVFDNNEGNDDEDFQAPIKLNAKNVDLNDASSKNICGVFFFLNLKLRFAQNCSSFGHYFGKMAKSW